MHHAGYFKAHYCNIPFAHLAEHYQVKFFIVLLQAHTKLGSFFAQVTTEKCKRNAFPECLHSATGLNLFIITNRCKILYLHNCITLR